LPGCQAGAGSAVEDLRQDLRVDLDSEARRTEGGGEGAVLITAGHEAADERHAATQPFGRQQGHHFGRVERRDRTRGGAAPRHGEGVLRHGGTDGLGERRREAWRPGFGVARQVQAHRSVEHVARQIGGAGGNAVHEGREHRYALGRQWRFRAEGYGDGRHRLAPHRLPQRSVLLGLGRPVEQDVEPDGGYPRLRQAVDQSGEEAAVHRRAVGELRQRLLGDAEEDEAGMRRLDGREPA
jgi:hypothetical protein